MKKLLLILLIIGAAGCNRYKEYEVVPEYELPTTIIMDSCEYYYFTNSHGPVSVHKGNCKNCRKFYKELLKEK